MSFAFLELEGYTTKDIEITNGTNGNRYNFTIAVDEYHPNNQSVTNYYRVTIWGDCKGKRVAKMKKGSRVILEGIPKPNVYNGNARIDVIINDNDGQIKKMYPKFEGTAVTAEAKTQNVIDVKSEPVLKSASEAPDVKEEPSEDELPF